MQKKYLSSMIISLMLVLPACAKEPSQSVTDEQASNLTQDLSDLQADSTSQTAQPSSYYPVIVSGKDVAPLSDKPLTANTKYDVMHAAAYLSDFISQWQSAAAKNYHTFQQGSRGQILGLSGYSGAKLKFEKVKAQVKLSNNEILVMGFSLGTSYGTRNAIDFGQGQLFIDANNLIINYLRYQKTPQPPERGQLEKTTDYDQRVKQYTMALQQSTQSINADLGLLEDALNFAAKDFSIKSKSHVNGTDQYIVYDPDQETISLQSNEVSAEDKRFRNVSISFSAHCPLALAQQMLAANHMERKGNQMAFVMRYHNQQLYLDRVIILHYHMGVGQYEYIGELSPETITLHSKGGSQLIQNPDMVIHRAQPLPFKFGLSTYQAPKVVSMSEASDVDLDPEFAESLANAQALENEIFLSDQELGE